MAYADPEKQKEYRRKYYQEHKEQEGVRQRKYNKERYRKNKEEILSKQKEYKRQYYEQNKEKQKEYRKKNYQEHKEERLQYAKEYRKTHPELISEIDSRYQKSMNDISRLTAHKHYQKWTPDEIEIFKHMIKQGYTYKEISLRLGRTLKSVQSMENKIRRKGHPFTGNPVDI